MSAEAILPKCKMNLIFHCLQDRVETSELSVLITRYLATASLVPVPPLPSPYSGQMRCGLAVLSSAFISGDSVPSLTVPMAGSVLRPAYRQPSFSFKVGASVTLESILPSSSQ